MKKNFLFIICLILLIVSVSSVSASADVNQTISDETGDSLALAADDETDLGDNNLSYMSDMNMQSDIDDGDSSGLIISGSDASSSNIPDLNVSDILSKIDWSKLDISGFDPSSLNIPSFDYSSLNVSDILSKIDWSKLDISGFDPSSLNIPGFDYSSLNVSDVLSKIDWSKLDISGFNFSSIDMNDTDLSKAIMSLDPSDIVDLDVPNVIKYYHGSERLEATYTVLGEPAENSSISFFINGVEYKATTNSEGKASVALNLNSGVYDVMARSLLIFKEAKVTIKPTIEGKDVIKSYKNATQYYAKFVDSEGNALKNTDVKFNINGIEYTRKTNESGVAQLNINLNSGDYILTATNPITNEMRSNTIQVVGLIGENRDLTKYFKNESQYTIRLFDDQGNPVGAGVSALFNINGVFYTRTTDENGYVTLNINLNPGDYIVTAEYKGYKVSNNIKVLPLIIASDLTKQFLDLTPFSVKLVNGHGAALIDKVITFNVNGVFYNRTTDLLGIARLNINLWPGEYIITSMYDEIGAVTSNKITITSIFG